MNKIFLSLDRILPFITIIVVVLFLIFSLNNTGISNSINGYLNQTGIAGGDIQTSKKIVTRVVDGDTLELNSGEKIRLLYIDTPETVKPGTPIQCYGKEASQKISNLVLDKEVYLTYDKDKQDRYGRELNFVYLSENDATSQNVEESVNAKMVEGGYARSVSYSPNTSYKDKFNQIMAFAIDNNLGIWDNCPKPFEE